MAGKRGNPNWVKGVSGNPNGRPPEAENAVFKATARASAMSAWQRIISLCDSDDEAIALKASIYVIERAYGKAPQEQDDKEVTAGNYSITLHTASGESVTLKPGQHPVTSTSASSTAAPGVVPEVKAPDAADVAIADVDSQCIHAVPRASCSRCGSQGAS